MNNTNKTMQSCAKKVQITNTLLYPGYCLVCRKVKQLSCALNYRRFTRLHTFFSNSFCPHNNFLSVNNQCWENKNGPSWFSGIKIGINELLFVYFLHINHISCSPNIFLVLWPPAVTHRPPFAMAESRAVHSCRVLSFSPPFRLSFSVCLTLIRCSWIIEIITFRVLYEICIYLFLWQCCSVFAAKNVFSTALNVKLIAASKHQNSSEHYSIRLMSMAH